MTGRQNYFFAALVALAVTAALSAAAEEGQDKSAVLQQAQMHFDKTGKAPTEIKFTAAQQPTLATFFQEYKKYFQISDDNQFLPFHLTHNALGSHHRYLQHYRGVPIVGAEYILHERNGKVWYANGLLVHDLKMEVTPSLGEAAARQAALQHIGAESYMWQDEANEAFLKRERNDANATFYPRGELKITSGRAEMLAENLKLVYRFDIYAAKPLGRYYVDVDAKTGEIVNVLTRIHDVDVAGSGASLYNGTVAMTVDQVSSSSFRLQENGNTVRGADIRTFNMNNGTSYTAATDFTSTSANGPWDGAGVSGHWGAEATYDYFFVKHNRNSLDNAGFTLLSYVHANLVGMGYPNNVNAFWDGSRMTYGDGDGVNYFPLVCLDVVGHELTHGVTDFSSNLIYQNESGALNESFSDIFGNAVEFFKENPGVESGLPVATWRVGEDMSASGLGIRNMRNPNEFSDPDTYQGTYWYNGTGDNGGVHTNSGVQNFWFYLLVEGGSGTNDVGYNYNVPAQGLTKAAAIAYTNNNSFLTSSSNYNAARSGAIAAAEGLYGAGSPEALATAEAWLAVGVGTIPQPPAEYATLPYYTGFESGALDNHWNTYKSNSAGRIRVLNTNGPYAGSYHLVMDVSSSGVLNQNEAWLHLNLAGQSQVNLAFRWKEFSDETHSQDGVYFSNNGGTNFVKVQSLSGSSTAWQSFNLDLDALAAANGLSLTSTFIVKFQQYDDYPITTDGFAFDEISVTVPGNNPPSFTNDPLNKPSATEGVAYSASLAGDATDPDNDPLTFSKVSGPAWLSVASNGALSGTPGSGDVGTNQFTVRVEDGRGGSDQALMNITVNPAGSGWVVITSDNFETGMGSYTDGGSDMSRYTGGTYAYQGNAAANIQDNSGTASSFYHTGSYNVTGYNTLEVDFYFIMVSMELNEDFWVQYYNGSAWQTVAAIARAGSVQNNVFYHAVVTIPRSTYNFPSNARLRFLCDASADNDDVYIDQIEFRGTTATAGLTLAKISEAVQVTEAATALPASFELMQNYPNPFNPTTTIGFALPEAGEVTLAIYNMSGQLVKRLVAGELSAGRHDLVWDATDERGSRVASGVYLYVIKAGEFTAQKKLVLMK
ncbi:M4 family metallopeptidase [bacterium]|nr:M4 family metallopeptidase [bacterium]